MKTKFKKGDIVKVSQSGYVYSTYDKMFDLFGFKNRSINGFNPKNNNAYTVVGITLHTDDPNNVLYGIANSDGDELVISEIGLTKYGNTEDYFLEFFSGPFTENTLKGNKLLKAFDYFDVLNFADYVVKETLKKP
jgi:hypothetical protein